MPVGAESQPDGGVHFRVWAPRWDAVSVIFDQNMEMKSPQKTELSDEGNGYFSGLIDTATTGDYYRYETGNGAFPDPASRFQPDGPHGPSQVVDPNDFEWTDQDWQEIDHQQMVIYEMHIGTFADAGTWRAAETQLPALMDLGVTTLEIMPIADFPGRFGWGYDGVNLFAPYRIYGQPDEFRQFVNHAHKLGLSVVLDVVYNHLGPDGNYLSQFSFDYFKPQMTEWGDALNFDGDHSEHIREYYIQNALYWIREYHLDGIRFDATQQMFDSSPEHILAAIVRRLRAESGRKLFLVAENEPQHSKLARSVDKNGYGMDAIWNDDFHHSAIVAMTGRNECYFSAHRGFPQEFISAYKRGFLYQGQTSLWHKNKRGTSALDLRPENFVVFIQNHDQIGNSLWGRRLHEISSLGQLRAITALLLLGPSIPMLFQGQEFYASSPFLYFGEHKPDLARAIAKGRAEFLSQFPSIASKEARAMLKDPEKEDTYQVCKLHHADRDRNHQAYNMHRDLLRLRREDPVIGKGTPEGFDGAVINSTAFLLRFFSEEHGDRLLIVNLGAGFELTAAPEPLLAAPDDHHWTRRWSSEDAKYGGSGTPPTEREDGVWQLPAQSTILFISEPF